MSGPTLLDAMPDVDYHQHPALSSSGAKKLLPPSCPALFKWERDNPPPPKPQYDLGHAVHALALGFGPELVTVDAEDWRSKAARDARDTARAAGKVPLLAPEHRQVTAMADALRTHPIAGVLFDPEHGKPEQSLFWTDDESGVQRRARLDWLPDAHEGRMILADLKTAVSAEPAAIKKAVANFGYYMQAAWYVDAARALGLADEVAMVFVFVEKTPPYLITVAELDDDAMRTGRTRNRRAIEVYAECSAVDQWPGYTTDVELISLPPWLTRRYDLGETA